VPSPGCKANARVFLSKTGTVRTLTSAQSRVKGLIYVFLLLIADVILVCKHVPLSPGIHPITVKYIIHSFITASGNSSRHI